MINMVKDMKYIKKINSKQLLYIITLIILITIPLTKLLGFYLQKYNVISNYNILNTQYILYLTIPFQVYLYFKNTKVSNNKSHIIDLIIMILIIATLTSSITAINPKYAFFGNQFRYEGFFIILGYYLLILNWKKYGEEIDIKRIIKIILLITVVHCLYGLLQEYTNFSFILRFSSNKEMITGIAFNPNFLGSLLVTSLGLTTSIFLTNDKHQKNMIFLTILFTLSLINTNSTGPLLTLFIILILLPIYLLILKKLSIKKYIILILTIILTIIGTITINTKIFNIKTCELCDTYQKIVKVEHKEEQNPVETSTTKEETKQELTISSEVPVQNQDIDGQYDVTNGRLEIWEKAFEIIRFHPLTGIGYDNFYLAYHEGKYYKIDFITDENGNQKTIKRYFHIVDNPHNVYLHVLTATGILGFIPYMLLLLITFIICIKKKNIVLTSTFVAYSIQAFVNINVIQIVPIYFIIIGLILSQTKELTK